MDVLLALFGRVFLLWGVFDLEMAVGMSDASEKVLYVGSPSQMVNFNAYFVLLIAFVFVMFMPAIWDMFLHAQYAEYKKFYMLASKILFFVPWVWMLVLWLKIRCHRYTITSERLKEEEGVLSKSTDELELFRVKDITYVEPFSLRVFGCGNIILDTSDKSTPIVVLYAIKNAGPVLDMLRSNVQIMRAKRGVREID